MFQRHVTGITAAQFVWEPLEEEAAVNKGESPRLPPWELHVKTEEMLHRHQKNAGHWQDEATSSRAGRRMRPRTSPTTESEG